MSLSIAIADQHYRDINPRVCGEENCAPGHSFGPAVREYWLLHYVISGEGVYRVRGESYRLHASQVFVIHPGELTYYQADKENPWRYVWIGFESGCLLPEALDGDVLTLPQCRALFESFLRAREMADGKEIYLCSKIWELLSILSFGQKRLSCREAYVQQAKNYIESEYMTDITVGEIAGRLGLDRSYFSSLFRQSEGKPPGQYLCEVRMRRAAEQLLLHQYTVTETAASVGYPDLFAFSRTFRRYFGMSPSEFRKKNKS